MTKSTFLEHDLVVMQGCEEAADPAYAGKVWRCRQNSYGEGKQEKVLLEGFSGAFLTSYLRKATADEIRQQQMANQVDMKLYQPEIHGVPGVKYSVPEAAVKDIVLAMADFQALSLSEEELDKLVQTYIPHIESLYDCVFPPGYRMVIHEGGGSHA